MTSFNAHKRPRIDRRETIERRRIEITMYTRARTHTQHSASRAALKWRGQPGISPTRVSGFRAKHHNHESHNELSKKN